MAMYPGSFRLNLLLTVATLPKNVRKTQTHSTYAAFAFCLTATLLRNDAAVSSNHSTLSRIPQASSCCCGLQWAFALPLYVAHVPTNSPFYPHSERGSSYRGGLVAGERSVRVPTPSHSFSGSAARWSARRKCSSAIHPRALQMRSIWANPSLALRLDSVSRKARVM